jgi:DNA-binding protein HU-beta
MTPVILSREDGEGPVCHGRYSLRYGSFAVFAAQDDSGNGRRGYNRPPGGRAMIKADIVNKVAEVSEISRVKAAQAVDTVIEGLRSALARGQRIELRGFGVFQVKQRKKGIGRNPKTGVEVKIPPGNTIRFKPGKELRNLL